MKPEYVEKLKQWFLLNQRDLPWRGSPSPYAVWVSEVMLQQTQVATVIPYFERWMTLFPNLEALALSPLDKVLKEWEGLGYYARARNLHAGACYVLKNFGGQLPNSSEKLNEIKGLGDYTIGAILSFAFHKRSPAVDGNVLRVLSRFYGLDDDISKGVTKKKIRVLAEELLPEKESWIITEALIELGATFCLRKAKCTYCPIKDDCVAYRLNRVSELPVNSLSFKILPLFRLVAVVLYEDQVLVRCGVKGEIMRDLFEFPYVDTKEGIESLEEELAILSERLLFSLSAIWQFKMEKVKHSFTRYKAILSPHFFITKEKKDIEGYQWISIEELKTKPFSSGHRQIFSRFNTCVY